MIKNKCKKEIRIWVVMSLLILGMYSFHQFSNYREFEYYATTSLTSIYDIINMFISTIIFVGIVIGVLCMGDRTLISSLKKKYMRVVGIKIVYGIWFGVIAWMLELFLSFTLYKSNIFIARTIEGYIWALYRMLLIYVICKATTNSDYSINDRTKVVIIIGLMITSIVRSCFMNNLIYDCAQASYIVTILDLVGNNVDTGMSFKLIQTILLSVETLLVVGVFNKARTIK